MELQSGVTGKIIEELVLEGRDDLVGLWEIVQCLEHESVGSERLFESSLDVVRALLARGFTAGNPPYHSDGFVPWTEQDHESVIGRIRSEWTMLDHLPSIPDIVWFSQRDVSGVRL